MSRQKPGLLDRDTRLPMGPKSTIRELLSLAAWICFICLAVLGAYLIFSWVLVVNSPAAKMPILSDVVIQKNQERPIPDPSPGPVPTPAVDVCAPEKMVGAYFQIVSGTTGKYGLPEHLISENGEIRLLADSTLQVSFIDADGNLADSKLVRESNESCNYKSSSGKIASWAYGTQSLVWPDTIWYKKTQF